MENELDERKRKILKAIIQTYLETGEPVGSRTISKYTDLNLSSATIRNEMSDLEELGYIIQPYTSAGRIPSDLGYRLYVDELMKEKDKEVAEIKDLMIEKTDKMEKVLKQVVKILASNTNYATMITGPTYHRNKLKFIQLSRVTETQLLAVVVVEGNLVKNHIIELREPMDEETVLKLNLLLNTQLNGLSIEEINLAMISRMKEQAGIHSEVVGHVLDAVAEIMSTDRPTIVEDAVAPEEPSSPSLLKNIAIGGAIGLILAMAVVILRFLMDDTIKTEEDVTKYLDLNTLAALPVDEKADPYGGNHEQHKGKRRKFGKKSKPEKKKVQKR